MSDDQQPDDIIFESEEEVVAEATQNDKLKKLRQELKTCQAEKLEYLTGWQRAKADLVNTTQRLEKEGIDRSKFATERLIDDLTPVLDSFTMAMANKEAWESVDANWRQGVEFIYSQLQKTLADYGLTEISGLGEEADPMLHESIEVIETDDQGQDHKIAEVVQTGYQMHDKVLRPAKVKVYQYNK